ncbi:response regulator transcription factor [Blastococcus sp. CT_GayMR16]|uniref:response regulator n=1 Tax=Blastococcus sp. CT_GayMR16 TaxID=2559607 RepID=UPI0010744D59|nr:response regulator transcription factor [Blastococcus sp. CT_GayMR16]TFV89633.1 response regulator transcription factor [Blastococcus sp. CT_GayMR16]
MTLRVLLADDQTLVRAGFRKLLESEPDVDVVAEAADGLEALQAAHRFRPDVVLMDIRMPRLDGLAATARLVAALPATRVVVLTTFDLDEYVFDALRAGASGFLLKDAPPEELVHALRVVAAGDALLAPSVTRRLIEEFARRPVPRADDRLRALTPREREVLVLVAGGLSNSEIAARLYLGESTVKTHLTGVLTKLDLRDRAQAVMLAYETGVVRPGG